MARTLFTYDQFAPIPTSILVDGAEFVQRDGSVVMTGDLDMDGNRVRNLGAPTLSSDATSAGYVHDELMKLTWKWPSRAATTANIVLSGEQTIDGVALVDGDRILVKNQTLPQENGIYVVAFGAWPRSIIADTSDKVEAGMTTFVSEGTLNGKKYWTLTTLGNIIVGTTGLTFVENTAEAVKSWPIYPTIEDAISAGKVAGDVFHLGKPEDGNDVGVPGTLIRILA